MGQGALPSMLPPGLTTVGVQVGSGGTIPMTRGGRMGMGVGGEGRKKGRAEKEAKTSKLCSNS